jgi:hypothetical protein
MKKLLLIMTSILLVSLVGFALAAPNNASENAQVTATPTLYGAEDQGNDSQEDFVEELIEADEYDLEQQRLAREAEQGSENEEQERGQDEDNEKEFSSNGIKARTYLQLTNEGEEEGPMNVQLSNGKNAEIKVMPDAASEKALERLKLKNCVEEQGCIIELKEVGNGDEVKPVYEFRTQRSSKVLGLFKAKMEVEAQVDAETGKLIKVKKPWWAFLASEPLE